MTHDPLDGQRRVPPQPFSFSLSLFLALALSLVKSTIYPLLPMVTLIEKRTIFSHRPIKTLGCFHSPEFRNATTLLYITGVAFFHGLLPYRELLPTQLHLVFCSHALEKMVSIIRHTRTPKGFNRARNRTAPISDWHPGTRVLGLKFSISFSRP